MSTPAQRFHTQLLWIVMLLLIILGLHALALVAFVRRGQFILLEHPSAAETQPFPAPADPQEPHPFRKVMRGNHHPSVGGNEPAPFLGQALKGYALRSPQSPGEPNLPADGLILPSVPCVPSVPFSDA